MKKKMCRHEKLMAVTLTVVMLFCLTACGQGGNNAATVTTTVSTASVTTTADATQNDKVSFPLKERKTYQAMVLTPKYAFEDYLSKCKFYNDMVEKTNVDFKWTYLGDSSNAMAQLNAMFAAGSEGDAIVGLNVINDANLSLFAASGLLMPIEKYVSDSEIMPNLNERVFKESPQTKGVITAPDGHIYALPRYNSFAPDYLENTMWINKAWLDKLGLKVPTTIEEFTNVLRAFRDNDLNGNGNPNDEIPLIFRNGDVGYSHMEALLGMWGIPTKDNVLDSYVFVQDGVVKFAPATQAWKDAVKTIGGWFKENLIWSEAFTGASGQLVAKLKNEIPVVGVFTAKTPCTTSYMNDYVKMFPPVAAGYKPVWFYHPGYMGAKNAFILTRSCKDADILMHWADQFYSLENSIAYQYGYPGDGHVELVDGKYSINTLDQNTTDALIESKPDMADLFSNGWTCFNKDDYANKLVLSNEQKQMSEGYELYKSILNPEPWPRPYFTSDDASRINELRTDIFNIVATNRATWASGQGNIDAEWNKYADDLDKAGIKEFIAIMQKAYDNYHAQFK